MAVRRLRSRNSLLRSDNYVSCKSGFPLGRAPPTLVFKRNEIRNSKKAFRFVSISKQDYWRFIMIKSFVPALVIASALAAPTFAFAQDNAPVTRAKCAPNWSNWKRLATTRRPIASTIRKTFRPQKPRERAAGQQRQRLRSFDGRAPFGFAACVLQRVAARFGRTRCNFGRTSAHVSAKHRMKRK